jgi:hypothetical protein
MCTPRVDARLLLRSLALANPDEMSARIERPA